MKRRILKMILMLFVLGGMVAEDLQAQMVTVLPNDGGTSPNGRAPSISFRRIQTHYLITPAEMAASGFLNGSSVGRIGFTYSAAVAAGTGPLAIYLENTSDVTNVKSATWATAISTMTLVHNATTTIPATATPNINFSGGSPFTYTGGGLYVAFDWGCYSGTLGSATTLCNFTGLTNGLKGGQNSTACPGAAPALANSSFRPETRLGTPQAANDAGVLLIYTLGSLPNGYAGGHKIQALIKNDGSNTLTSLNVTLNITGANSFSDVQTIASLAPDATAKVTFAGFTPTATGANTVTVYVPADDATGNDSKSITQNITTNQYSYDYPGFPPNTGLNQGVGFNVTGPNQSQSVFISKFNASTPTAVNEVRINFTAANQNRFYRIAMFPDSTTKPGWPSKLPSYVSTQYSFGTNAQLEVKSVSPSVPVNGNFYVGVIQDSINSGNMNYAFYPENPVRDSSMMYGLFANFGMTTANWTDFSPAAPFRTSLSVLLDVPVPPNCASYILPLNGGSACSNGTLLQWGSGGGAPTGYRLTFGNNSPNYDNILNNVDMGAVTIYPTGPLSAGTYGWKVVPYNAQGDATGCSGRTFTTSFLACYCSASSTDGTFEYISNASGNQQGNPSASGNYQNHTGIGSLLQVNLNDTAKIQVTITNPYEEDFIYVYMDLNQDGDFTDVGETVGTADPTGGLGSGTQVVTVTLNIPYDATPGTTLMRIKMGDNTLGWNGNTPCGSFTYGEVEDYFVTLKPCGARATATPAVLCEFNPINFSGQALGGTAANSYAWSSNSVNGFSSGIQNPSIPSANSGDDGEYTLTIDQGACGTITSKVTVAVSPGPQPYFSPDAACQGSTLSLSGSNEASGQGLGNSYSWTTPNNGTINTQNLSIPNAPLAAAGNYTLTVLNQYNCSYFLTQYVGINPRPAASVVGSVTDVSCNGGSDGSFTVTSSGTAPFTFNVSGDEKFDDPSTYDNLAAGDYYVHVTDDNSCESNPDLLVHIDEPSAISVATGPTANPETCAGAGDGSIVVTVQGGTPGYTYHLSGAATASNGTGTFTGLGQGFYDVDVTDANGCTFNAATGLEITGPALTPAGPISGLGGICRNTNATYSIPVYAAANNYIWTPAPGGTVVSGQGTNSVTISYNNTANSGTVCVQVTTVCGNPAQVCLPVVLRTQKPAQPSSISSVNEACAGDNVAFSVPAAARADYYLWTAPSSGNIISGQGTQNIVVHFNSNPPSTDSVKVVAQNCIGSSAQRARGLKSLAPAAMVATINGVSKACAGQSIVQTINDIGYPSYYWSVTGGTIANGQGSTSITINVTSIPVTVCVQAQNGCGLGPQKCKTITSDNPTQPASISGPTTGVCYGATEYNYSISPVANAVDYLWSATAGGNVTSGQFTTNAGITFPTTFVTATVSVVSRNLCGNSAARTLIVNGTLGMPGAISGPTDALCNGSGSYSIATVPGATGYSWTLNNVNQTSSSNPTPNSLAVNFGLFTSGTICVAANNACGAGPQKCLTVKGTPPSVGSITGPSTVCIPQLGVVYSCGSATSATGYSWGKPSGSQFASGQGTQSVSINFNSGTGGEVSVKPVNSCGNGPKSAVTVSVNCPRIPGAASEMNSVDLMAMPNPTSGDLFITFETAQSMEYTLILTDLAGRELHTVYGNSVAGLNQQYFDMSQLSKGVYLISLKAEKASGVIRIVVE